MSDLPEPNDGTVAVEETRIEGMSDHIVLPVTHTGMIMSASVADHVVRFLNTGRFEEVPGTKRCQAHTCPRGGDRYVPGTS